MRTLSTFVVIAAVALSAGCRRNPGPSLEYVEAKGLYDRLIVNQGDDAYASAQMTEVEELLKKVEADSPDSAAAKELLATITSERQRVEEEARAAATPQTPPDLSAQFETEADGEAALQDEATADAGVDDQPREGMEVSELLRSFPGCFEQGPELMVQGLGLRSTYVLGQTPACRERHASFDRVALLVQEGKIAGFARYDPDQRPAQSPQPQQPTHGVSAQPPRPPAEPDATRPEAAPGDRGRTKEDYDSIKY